MIETPTSKPLYSEEAERAVLGSCLLAESEKVLDIYSEAGLSPAAFFVPANRLVFEEILALRSLSVAIDIVTLAKRLEDTGLLERVGGISGLDGLIESTPTAEHAEFYADILLECERKRGLQQYATGILDSLTSETESFDIIAKAEADLIASNGRAKRADKTPKEIADGIIRNWEGTKKTGITGVPSAFRQINNVMGGYSEYTVLAARPAQGKSTLMLNEVLYQASHGYPVAVASLEMSDDQCYRRMACNRADVSMFALDHGHASDRQMVAAAQSLMAIVPLPIYVSDQSQTPDSLASWARRLVLKHGIKILWVDYLQIMTPGQRYGGMTERITDFSGCMLRLRKQLGIPVVVLSQLSRLNDRENRAPKLSDLRDSGAIEQDAHTVMFLSSSEDAPEEETIVDIAKNRDGPLGEGRLKKNFSRQRFEEVETGVEGESQNGM